MEKIAVAEEIVAVTEEPEYNLSQNDFSKALNSGIKQAELADCIACVATHRKTGAMHYVLFYEGVPVCETPSGEAIAAHIDIIKLHRDFEKKEGNTNERKKVSRRGNRNMPHRLRNSKS